MTIRQFKMLELFTSRGFTIDEALNLHQTTFGSLCYHKWVIYSTKSFVRSHLGDEMIRLNQDIKLHRDFNNHKFSVRVVMKAKRRAA